MISNINVFCAIMCNRILCQCNAPLIVFKHNLWRLLLTWKFFRILLSQIASWQADKAMYSDSAVDNATVGCLLDFHETGTPPIVNRWTVVDLRESRLPAQSASEYPTRVSLLGLNNNPWFSAPFRYLRIRLTAAQCVFPGLLQNFATSPTATAMSGLFPVTK